MYIEHNFYFWFDNTPSLLLIIIINILIPAIFIITI